MINIIWGGTSSAYAILTAEFIAFTIFRLGKLSVVYDSEMATPFSVTPVINRMLKEELFYALNYHAYVWLWFSNALRCKNRNFGDFERGGSVLLARSVPPGTLSWKLPGAAILSHWHKAVTSFRLQPQQQPYSSKSIVDQFPVNPPMLRLLLNLADMPCVHIFLLTST